ncbi:MAG: flagellar protein FlgN [Nitrospirae bacterium]|nr:flagellar protein FlgN [Nitrospirota bacterium]
MSPSSLDVLLIKFYSTLGEMTKGYQQFMSILQKEKSLIIEGNSEELITCLLQKEGVISYLNGLESKREAEIEEIGRALGLTSRPLTFVMLIDAVKEPFKSKFISCKAGLEALTASMIEVNQINGLLVERTLRKITDLIGLINQISAVPITYSSNGVANAFPAKGRSLART